MNDDELLDQLRREPRYSIAESAALVGLHPATVAAWVRGRAVGSSFQPPVVPVQDRLSFLDLVELVVVRGFRTGRDGVSQIPLERLRAAHVFARERLGIDHPFASERLFYEGGHIMHDFEGANPGPGRLAVDMDGQFVLPLHLAKLREQFDYDTLHRLALRWFPLGRENNIVVNPAIASGRPSIAGRNLRVDFIVQRFKEGRESIDAIAEDLELERTVVEAALRLAA